MQLGKLHRGIAPLGVFDGGGHPAQFHIAVQHEFDGGAVERGDFLLHVGDLQRGRKLEVAAVGSEVAANGGEQAGLAGAVGAGESHALAAKHGEIDVLE
jgi:hypothetical protein